MYKDIYVKKIKYPGFFAACTAAFISLLLLFPVRLFLGHLYFGRASAVLDDKTTEALDRMEFSAGSAAAYQAAIASIETASALVPSKAFYRKKLADIHLQSAIWSKAMEDMKMPAIASNIRSSNSLEQAKRHLEQALILEPVNAYYHLQAGQLFREENDAIDEADRELQLAIELYPVNGPLRYAVATEYLLLGRRERAFAQAQALASADDTYRVNDEDPGNILDRKKRVPWYVSRLINSYLFRALEIAWRASGKDPTAVAAIVPDNADAQEAAHLFFDSKGIDYIDRTQPQR